MGFSVSISFVSIFLGDWGSLVLGLSIFSSFYSWCWDVYMDWGLFPDFPRKLVMRHERIYHKHVYYIILFFNTLFRLTWAVTLLPEGYFSKAVGMEHAPRVRTTIVAVEIIRRGLWIILKVEYEHVSKADK